MAPFWGRCYFSGDWDVHWEYGILTHDHMRLLCLVKVTHFAVLSFDLGLATASVNTKLLAPHVRLC